MTGAPDQGAHELDPLSTRFGAPEPLVLVSPPSAAPAVWAPPPAVEFAPTPDAAGATPEGERSDPCLLERLGQNCYAPPLPRERGWTRRGQGGPWFQVLAGNLADAGRAARRAWLDALDRAWAPRAHRRALELGRKGRARAADCTPEAKAAPGCACVACAAQALVEPRGLLPVPEWTLPDPVTGEVCRVPAAARELGPRQSVEVVRRTGEPCQAWAAVPPPVAVVAPVVRRARPGARPELVAPPDAPRSPPTAGAWYDRRAASLARPIRERVDGCGKGSPLVVECGCGRVKVPTTCGQRQACDVCMRRTFRRLRARLAKAMRARVLANGRANRGGRRGSLRLPVMLTLTVRHTGNLLEERKTIQRGWERLRAWLHRRLRAASGRGQFDYALTWETTPGTDGLGHGHAHVVALLPFVPFDELRDEWVRATRGASTGIHCAAPKDKEGRRLRGDRAAARAAEYLAKYASKGTCELGAFTPELAADVLDAAWGRRVCSTSYGFWLPKPPCKCKACGELWLVVEKPAKGERQRAVWAPELRIWVEWEDGSREERWHLPFTHPGGAILR